MTKKLTLSIEKDIIEKIKHYALVHNISISQITQNIYIKILETNKSENEELSATVRKYKGLLKNKIKNERNEITDYLINKH